jgi:hypothetical protein
MNDSLMLGILALAFAAFEVDCWDAGADWKD